MADWRRHNCVDLIWRGALVLSCLVHLCVGATGWMLISKVDKRSDIVTAIQVTFVTPKPKPVSKSVVRPISPIIKNSEQLPIPREEPPPMQKQPAVAQKIKLETLPKLPQPELKPIATPVVRQVLPTVVRSEQERPAERDLPSKRKNQKMVRNIQSQKPPPRNKTDEPTQAVLSKSEPKVGIKQQAKPKPVQTVIKKRQQSPKETFVRSPVKKPELLSVIKPKNVQPSLEVMREESTVPLFQPSTDITAVEPSEPEEEIQPTSEGRKSIVTGELDNYLTLLREKIDRYKNYPLMARKSRQQGVVLVEFNLSKEGHLKDCQLKKSCGYRLLDRAALQAVKAAAPFPDVPSTIELNMTSFIVPVRFVIN
jgi:periplasmic protein TonB